MCKVKENVHVRSANVGFTRLRSDISGNKVEIRSWAHTTGL